MMRIHATTHWIVLAVVFVSWIGFLAVWSVACVPSDEETVALDRSALESRFREEAPPAWKRLESKHRETRFDWKETEFNNARDEQKVSTTSGSNCYRGEDFVIRLKGEGETEEEAWGGNDRYLFTVTGNSDDGPWALGHFGPRTDDPLLNGDHRFGVQPRIPWRIYNVPCDVIIADPSFKIQSLEKNPDGSVELQFSLSLPTEHDGHPQLTSGRVLLLPDRDWAISEYEANLTRPTRPTDPPVVVLASVVHGPEEDGFMNLKHTKYELRWQSGEKQRWTRWERDVICRHCEEPAESFSLASFGLPEPALPSEANAKTGHVSGVGTPLVIDASGPSIGIGTMNPTIIAEGSPGSTVVLEVSISNRGNRTVQVLGASTSQPCLPSGCAEEVPDLPMEIKGHESKMTRVVYRIGRQDEPPYVLTFYTDCVSQPQLNLTIRNKYTD